MKLPTIRRALAWLLAPMPPGHFCAGPGELPWMSGDPSGPPRVRPEQRATLRVLAEAVAECPGDRRARLQLVRALAAIREDDPSGSPVAAVLPDGSVAAVGADPLAMLCYFPADQVVDLRRDVPLKTR